jgi:hypothetical protein
MRLLPAAISVMALEILSINVTRTAAQYVQKVPISKGTGQHIMRGAMMKTAAARNRFLLLIG